MLSQIAHRPYPPPDAPWVLAQTWDDLLFAHWPVPAAALRKVLPPQLPLDTFEGQAYLGIVPFKMNNVHPRLLPPFPWLSYFPELNVRTYVTMGGEPGVYFFSLDAGNPVAVRLARRFFHLPYFDAAMSIRREGDLVIYASRRTHKGAPGAEFRGRYHLSGPLLPPAPGSLASWLTDRYCLYTVIGSAVYRGEIHHPPWPLQLAEAEFERNTMSLPLDLPLPPTAPLLHFSRHQEVVAWLPTRLDATSLQLGGTGVRAGARDTGIDKPVYDCYRNGPSFWLFGISF